MQPLFFPKLLSFSSIVSLILIGACSSKPAVVPPKAPPPTVVDVLVAGKHSIDNIIEANGTVVANEYVELHPETSGRLTYLNVSEGNHVAAGTLIARIYDADLQAQLQKSRVQLELAEKTEERYRKLLEINGLNQSDYDAILNQVNGYKADMAYTQALIEKTVIKAPFDGVLGLRQVSPGAFVTPSVVIATLQQVDKVKVDFTIPEQYSDIIHKGNTVDIQTDQQGSRIQKALIIATEPQVSTNTRNLKVRALMDKTNANPGGFVKVFVNAGRENQSILLPTNCLIPDDKNNQVILVKQGKASFVNVSTGVREANNVEITQGIQPGDTVVVTGVLFARPKSALKIRSVKTLDQLSKQ
jgi:membrane fusion protein, multidrug efflux system